MDNKKPGPSEDGPKPDLFANKTVRAYKCSSCEKILTEGDKNKWFVIHGNITVGVEGGVIGNNFAENGTLQNVTIMCYSCLSSLIDEHKPKPTTRDLK
mgnify:CR=1 FL=1